MYYENTDNAFFSCIESQLVCQSEFKMTIHLSIYVYDLWNLLSESYWMLW